MQKNYFYIALSALIGIITANMPLAILLLLAFIVCLKWRQALTFPLFSIIIVSFSLFALRAYDDYHSSTKLPATQTNFQIHFLHSIKIDGNSFSAYGKEGATKEKLVVRFTIPTKEMKERLQLLKPGMVCEVIGSLEEPNQPRNRNAFNYQQFLKQDKIFWILKTETLHINSCEKEHTPLTYIYSLRQKGIQYVDEYFPKNISPLAAALIFGDRNLLDEDLLSAYERLGIVHLLAISGLHVGLLMGMLFYSGIRLGLTREKVTTLLLIFIPFYIFITGAAPSVVRAGLMVFIVLFTSKKSLRKIQTVDILSIVFLIILFLKPLLLYHAGFQLSFIVTCALLLSANILKKYSHRPIALLFVVSLISQIASIPFMLYHFYEFSIVSLLLNVVYVPLFSVVILPMMLLLFVGSFFIPLTPIFMIIDFYMEMLNGFTKWLSEFPYSTLVLGRPHTIFFIFYFVAAVNFFYRWEKDGKLLSGIIPLAIACLFQFHGDKFNPAGEVTFIDVGQGDSILIKLPYDKGTYLIDTGGTFQFPVDDWQKREKYFEVGENILVPYLKSRGIRTIDKLILTHGDLDHVGGAFAVMEHLHVEEILFPINETRAEPEKEIIELCGKKGISYKFVKAGDGWQIGEQIFYILFPLEGIQLEKNDQSIVLFTQLGGLTWLFTGDLEERGEQLLLGNYPQLTADMLKVGHHGSRTSTTEAFLSQIKPQMAFISAGSDNRFGHPHEEVVSRLERFGIKTYRTDENGEISLKFRKKRGTFFVKLHTIK